MTYRNLTSRMQRVAIAAGAAAAVAVAGCGADPDDVGDQPTAEQTAGVRTPDPGPAAGGAVEDHRLTFEWQDEERDYRLEQPAEHDQGEPVPLVMVLHGGGSSAASVRAQARTQVFAEEFGALVAYPEAIGGMWGVNPDRDGDVDVGFLTALIAHLVDEWNVAPDEVYVAGWSMGAEMAYRLAMEAPRAVTAIAPVSGNMIFPPESLDLPEPVSVVGFVGLVDRAVANTDSLGLWRDLLDCPASPPQPVPGADHVHRIEAQCADGSLVVEYQLDGTGHVWPNEQSNGLDANRAIWDFVRSLS